MSNDLGYGNMIPIQIDRLSIDKTVFKIVFIQLIGGGTCKMHKFQM